MVEKYKNFRSKIKTAIKANPKLNQKVVALEAGITDAYLSQLLAGVRKGDDKIFTKLAEIVGIRFNPEKEFIDTVSSDSVPFPRFMEVMALPVPKRPWAIKSVAAAENGLFGWNESTGDGQLHENKEVPREHQRYFDGEITEIDLFEMYDRYFKRMVKKLDNGLKKEGL